MTTKIIVIIAASIAAVVFMFIMGKLAEGKDDKREGEGK